MFLATPFGEDMMVRVSTDQATTLALDHFQIGFKTPIMHSTSGHVILAYASDVYRSALIDLLKRSDDPLQAEVHIADRVRHIIEKVRARGFEHLLYLDYAEASIAVPIFLEGMVVATLLLMYIKRAIAPQTAEGRFAPMLIDLAAQIEREVIASKSRVLQASRISPGRGRAI